MRTLLKTNGKPNAPGRPRRKSIARARRLRQREPGYGLQGAPSAPASIGSRPSVGPTRGAPCASFGDLGGPAYGPRTPRLRGAGFLARIGGVGRFGGARRGQRLHLRIGQPRGVLDRKSVV